MSEYSDPAAYWQKRLADQFDLTGAGFASLGAHYNARLYQARLQALERALANVKRSLIDAKVLELGCGTGHYTAYFAANGVRDYLGLDITSISVNTLRQRYPQFTFRQIDVTGEVIDLGESFDFVLVADVLFHIMDDAGFRVALQNLGNWVSLGGLIVISDVFPQATAQTAPHVRNRALSEYMQLLADQGFRLEHVEPIFAVLHPPPFVGGYSFIWQVYSRMWQYGWRLARWSLADRVLPKALGWFDDHLLLTRIGSNAPNSKWLVALRT